MFSFLATESLRLENSVELLAGQRPDVAIYQIYGTLCSLLPIVIRLYRHIHSLYTSLEIYKLYTPYTNIYKLYIRYSNVFKLYIRNSKVYEVYIEYIKVYKLYTSTRLDCQGTHDSVHKCTTHVSFSTLFGLVLELTRSVSDFVC